MYFSRSVIHIIWPSWGQHQTDHVWTFTCQTPHKRIKQKRGFFSLSLYLHQIINAASIWMDGDGDKYHLAARYLFGLGKFARNGGSPPGQLSERKQRNHRQEIAELSQTSNPLIWSPTLILPNSRCDSIVAQFIDYNRGWRWCWGDGVDICCEQVLTSHA